MDIPEYKPEIPKEPRAKTKTYKTPIIPLLATAIEIIAIIALSALATLVQIDFDFNEIIIGEFLVYLALRLVMLYCAKDVSARARVSYEQKTQAWLDLVAKFTETIKDIVYSIFENYVLCVVNPEGKIAAYKEKTLRKCEKKERKRDKLSVRSKIAFKNGNSKKVEKLTKKISDLNIEIEELKAKLTDEYIKNNIDNIRVKYRKLSPSQFLVVDTSGDVASDIYSMSEDVENARQNLAGIPFTILLITFVSVVSYQGIRFGEVNFLSFALDLLSVAINFSMGWFFVGAKTASKQKKVITNKIFFIESFKNKKGV